MAGDLIVVDLVGNSMIVSALVPGPPGALSSPTGTGFVHVTSGTIDAAARAVNVATADVTGVLPYTNGGTGLSTLGSPSAVLQVNPGGTGLQFGTVPLAVVTAPTGSGVAMVASGVWSAAASLGTTKQILVVNAGATAAAWVSLSADVTITAAGAATVGAIQGNTVTSGVLTKGYYLIASSTTNWVATQMTGDVTSSATSPGVTSVAYLQGASVPAGTGLTTGNVLHVTGASALGYGALNLAGGAGYVTGALPATNLAPGTAAQILVTNAGATAAAWVSMSGDATISAAGAVTVASAQSGLISWAATTALETIAATATAPGIKQATAGSGVTPVSFTIAAQAPNAGSGTTASGTGGNVVVALAAPVSTGAEAGFVITRNGTPTYFAGSYPGYPNSTSLWLGALAATTPSTSNWALYSDSSLLQLNCATTVEVCISGPAYVHITSSGVQLFNGSSGAFASGAGVLGITKASTNPSASISTGSILYADSSTGALCVYVPSDTSTTGPTASFSNATWSGGKGQALTIQIAASTGATNALGIYGQSTSVSGGTGGAVYIASGAASGGGASTSGLISISTASTGVTGGSITLVTGGATTTIGALYVQPGGSTALTFAYSSSLSQVVAGWNCPVGGAPYAYQWGTNPNAIAFGTAGGTHTVSTGEMSYPVQVLTSGTLGAMAVYDFTTVCTTTSRSGFWLLDISGMSIGSTNGLTVKNGTASMTYTTNLAITPTLVVVNIRGANTLVTTV